MKSVLLAHAQLGGRPIELLSVAQARKQAPTVADALNTVLKDRGLDNAPHALVPGITSVDGTIPGPASALRVRIYTPRGKAPFPVISRRRLGHRR